MKITHPSFIKILQRDNGDSFARILLNRNFNDFIKEIDLISNDADQYGYPDVEIEGDVKLGKHKFIGDLFEVFTEAFFIQFKSDPVVGVYDYKPVFAEDDNGVDGFGKNIHGAPCTIQVKYRGNPTYLLKERDIKQFPYQSIVNYGIDEKRSDNMIIFTNCQGLHWYTESKVFCNKMRVINGETISKLIDNNMGFWETFKDLTTNSVKEIGVDKLTELFINKIR